MAVIDKNTIVAWFVRQAKPLADQFATWIDSYWHKLDEIPMSSIFGLNALLADKADKSDIAAINTALDSKASKEALAAVSDGVIKQDAVDTYNDTTGGKTSLLSQYADPDIGWDVYVRAEKTRYNWNGDKWVNLETNDLLESLGDVSVNASAAGDILQFDGANWVNVPNLAIKDNTGDLRYMPIIVDEIGQIHMVYDRLMKKTVTF